MRGERPYSRKQKGSCAFGARVLSFVRFEPNDGFRPQSGLVQREFYSIAAAGSCIHESKRVQGASMDKTVQPPWRAGKNKQTALTGVGNAPLLPPAAASSPEGQILAALCLEGLMSTEAERRANFPLRGGKGTGFVGSRRATENPVTRFPLGEVPPQAGIGVHFHERSEVVWFSLPLAALPPLAAYKTHRPTGRYHNPLNPLNLLTLLNPHAAGVFMTLLNPLGTGV